MQPPRPDLFTYLDHRAWLRDWFAWKKASNPRYSHRAFARRAGQRSPSLLLLVSKGERNLTEASRPGFAKAMDLDGEETAFFFMLIDLDAAVRDEERNTIFAQIAATRRFQAARSIEGDAFRFLSHWYIPAVRELAGCPGFSPDPSWIARALRPRITLTQARTALDILQQLGMLRIDDAGAVHVTDVSIVTPHEVAGLAVHNYHKGMLARSQDAIEGFRPDERQLGAVTATVPTQRLAELKQAVAAFQDQFLDLADAMAGEAGPDDELRVVQMNLQLFPLSVPVPPPGSPPLAPAPDED